MGYSQRICEDCGDPFFARNVCPACRSLVDNRLVVPTLTENELSLLRMAVYSRIATASDTEFEALKGILPKIGG